MKELNESAKEDPENAICDDLETPDFPLGAHHGDPPNFYKLRTLCCMNNLATCQQGCYKLLTACSKLVDNLREAVRTQLVNGLLTDLLQDVRFLRVYMAGILLGTCPVCVYNHFRKCWTLEVLAQQSKMLTKTQH